MQSRSCKPNRAWLAHPERERLADGDVLPLQAVVRVASAQRRDVGARVHVQQRSLQIHDAGSAWSTSTHVDGSTVRSVQTDFSRRDPLAAWFVGWLQHTALLPQGYQDNDFLPQVCINSCSTAERALAA